MSIEVGSVLEGTISGITKFGAFVELPEDKTGLIHISEVATAYVNDINDFLTVGQKVKVKVLSINDRGRIGLSIKKLQEESQPPERPAARPASTGFRRPSGRYSQGPASFEDKLSKFLKESDEKLTDLKRKVDMKRGGRGQRRPD